MFLTDEKLFTHTHHRYTVYILVQLEDPVGILPWSQKEHSTSTFYSKLLI